ncbi:MAG: nucleotidyl transferase AbiEii/AbiGii toxin family protein [Candidatus Levybacteria bacterium]|jgi:predicted nucleotidyltransferase component of viral defense system|nr:nucleotidyl transferase AbiEii/AbiGii toxin family protein [Candidatus Levybacteria bacterium]
MEPNDTERYEIMITKDEIKQIAHSLSLRDVTVEKDYVLGWVLAAIGSSNFLRDSWIFKGGTCLRKCYFENYRFSEDLDFTIVNTQSIELNSIVESMREIANWVYENSGIEISTKKILFESVKNPANQTITQGRIFYKGPIGPSSPQQWPRIKFDLTPDEIIVKTPVQRSIIHKPYSDHEIISHKKIHTYDLVDLFAEKIRALFERTRPRDLYDVVEIYNISMQDVNIAEIHHVLRQKCAYKGLVSLNIDDLPKNQCLVGWKDQLSHQLANLPDFESYFNEFSIIHKKLRLGEIWNESP